MIERRQHPDNVESNKIPGPDGYYQIISERFLYKTNPDDAFEKTFKTRYMIIDCTTPVECRYPILIVDFYADKGYDHLNIFCYQSLYLARVAREYYGESIENPGAFSDIDAENKLYDTCINCDFFIENKEEIYPLIGGADYSFVVEKIRGRPKWVLCSSPKDDCRVQAFL